MVGNVQNIFMDDIYVISYTVKKKILPFLLNNLAAVVAARII